MAKGRLDPNEGFTAMVVTRGEIADFFNEVYADSLEPGSLGFMPLDGTEDLLTETLCNDFCDSMETSLSDGIDEDSLMNFAIMTLEKWGGKTLE